MTNLTKAITRGLTKGITRGLPGSTQSLPWALDLTSQNFDFACTSTRNVWSYSGNPAAGNSTILTSTGAGVPAVVGARWNGSRYVITGTDESPLHPYTLIRARTGMVRQYTSFPTHATSTAYSAGTQVAILTSAGNWVYMTSDGGTSAGTAPTVTDADIGSTVSDNDITWTVNGYAALHKGGLLGEGAGTNYLLRSEEFDNAVVWPPTSVTVTPNQVVAPDSNATADLLEPTGADSKILQVFTPPSTNEETYSIWLKAKTSSFDTTLRLQRVAPFATVASSNITVTTAWQRLYFSASPLDTSSHQFVIGAGSTLSTGEDFYAWGAQAEVGSNPTSYIITSGATATRNASTISETISDLGISSTGWAVDTVINPCCSGQTAYLIGSYVDADNYTAVIVDSTTVTLRKRISASNTDVVETFTHTSEPFRLQAYADSTGMGIRAWAAGDATPSWHTDADTTASQLGSTFEFLSDGNNANHFDGHILNNKWAASAADMGW